MEASGRRNYLGLCISSCAQRAGVILRQRRLRRVPFKNIAHSLNSRYPELERIKRLSEVFASNRLPAGDGFRPRTRVRRALHLPASRDAKHPSPFTTGRYDDELGQIIHQPARKQGRYAPRRACFALAHPRACAFRGKEFLRRRRDVIAGESAFSS